MTINVIDKARPELAALTARIENPLPGLMIAGREVSNLLRKHYTAKEADEPNKLGGPRQHFWLQIAHSVNAPVPSGLDKVVVSVSDPRIMQKVKGGTITAKRADALTIPMRPEAYGRRASVLEHALGIKLFVISKGGRAFLAGRVGKGPSSGLRIFYVLKKSVNQAPDPTALPPQDEMERTAMDAFSAWALSTKQ